MLQPGEKKHTKIVKKKSDIEKKKKSDIEAPPVSSIPAANPFDGSKGNMYDWSTGRDGQRRFLAAGTAASRNLNGILLHSFASLCQLSSDPVLVGRPVGDASSSRPGFPL